MNTFYWLTLYVSILYYFQHTVSYLMKVTRSMFSCFDSSCDGQTGDRTQYHSTYCTSIASLGKIRHLTTTSVT